MGYVVLDIIDAAIADLNKVRDIIQEENHKFMDAIKDKSLLDSDGQKDLLEDFLRWYRKGAPVDIDYKEMIHSYLIKDKCKPKEDKKIEKIVWGAYVETQLVLKLNEVIDKLNTFMA